MEKIVVPMPKSLIGSIDEKKGDLSREAFVGICVHHTLGLTGNDFHLSTYLEEEGSGKALPWKNNFDRAWLAAILSYGLGDTIASYLALKRTGIFVDPVLGFLFKDNFYPVIPFKLVILLSALLISYSLLENKHAALILPIILFIAGVLLIMINILYIIGV